VDPIRYDETCPSSDGAAAVVIGNEESAEAHLAQGHPVAWIHATALRTEPLQFSGRDQVSPQASRDAAAALWKGAGITSRSTRSTSRRSTCRSPGSSRCGWRVWGLPPKVKVGSSPKPARPQWAESFR